VEWSEALAKVGVVPRQNPISSASRHLFDGRIHRDQTEMVLELLPTFAASVCSALKSHRVLVLENLALRHQVSLLMRRDARPRPRPLDRLLWIMLRRLWSGWRTALVVVKPGTVVRWHREYVRRYWSWRSRRPPGRPRLNPEVVTLIRRMASANPLWGAPRIHGELLKLGIDVSERTVSRYVPKRRTPPSQTWRTFLANHMVDLIAIDFFYRSDRQMPHPLLLFGPVA
jgi:putative transposase